MTRDDLEQLDTKHLRALAREHLAAQARSLRTRGALLAALTRTLAPTGPLQAPASPEGHRRPGKLRSAVVRHSPTPGATPRPAVPHVPSVRPAPAAARAAAPSDAGLVEEGFFLPQGAPRPEPRRVPARAPQEGPAEAQAAPPAPLADETPHLLARDATTLFLFWDFRRDLERGAALGLQAPRVHFRLFEGEVLVRTIEAPLGRRSLYLEGLTPGHAYSVEAWLAGSDGHARPTGRRSASVRLAPDAPSARLDVEMVRVPLGQPLAGWHPEADASAPSSPRTPLAAPSRVELPASLDWRGGPGPAGPGSGRP